MEISKKSLKSRLLKGGVWAFSAKAGTGILTIILSALVTRLMTPSDVGAFFLVFSVVSALAMLGRAGLEQVSLRIVAEKIAQGKYNSAREIIRKIIYLAAFFIVTVALVTYLFFGEWLAVNSFSSQGMEKVIGLMSLWLIVVAIQLLFAEIFRAFHDVRSASLFSGGTIFGGFLSSIIAGVVLLFLWVRYETISIETSINVVLFAITLSIVASLPILIGKLLTLRSKQEDAITPSSSLLKLGASFLVTNVGLMIMMQADIWVIAALLSEENVAVYAASTRLVKLVMLLLLVANEVIAPVIVELNTTNQREKLERLLRLTATAAALPAVIILLGFVFLGSSLLEWVFGDYYVAGTTALILLSAGQFVSVWSGSCGYLLSMTGHQNTTMIITVISGLLIIIGAIIVAGPYGIEGVAAVVSLSWMFQKITLLILARIRCKVWTYASPILAVTELRAYITRKYNTP